MLYTIRGECDRDLEGTLRAVAGLGYEGVELYSLHGHPAERVRGWLDEFGLVAVGRHAGLEALETSLPELAEEVSVLGFDRIALSWIEPKRSAVGRIEAVAEAARALGLRFGFHNHDLELAPLDDGGENFLDLLRELPRDLLWLELDLGWVWYAGADPVEQLERTSGRCPLVHVKDFRSRESRDDVPVGDGAVGYERVVPAALAAGVEWLLVEEDEVEGPPIEAVERSLRALERMLARVNTPARVGVVGCGVIAEHYVEDSAAFESWQPVACADLDQALAETFASEHALRAETVDELLADTDVDVVLNLTPPNAHAAVIRDALARGKHVYTEKPLATTVEEGAELVAEAERLGLRIGCAPDTFLGSAYETGSGLIESGEIGEPLGFAATMLVGGPDSWHPNAEMFYRAGGGPMLDIAPYYLTAIAALVGPYSAAAALAATPTPDRTFGAGPRTGETFAVEVPTLVAAVLELERGAIGTLNVSFEARGQYVSGLFVYGDAATLSLPDANAFGGEVRIKRGRGDWTTVPYESRGRQETRGLGLHEMVEAMTAGRDHRAGGALGLHILETATAVLRAADERRTIDVESR